MTYRADIDGLRALAVISVIFFHYGIPGFSGGFIGVDVFFVLSGYLIGSIIFSQVQQDRFSFKRFYFRRVRRLFPAYALVVLTTFIFAYWLMLPNNFRDFGQSLLASGVYASNILFYREAGYFDTASHLKPLLHTWSLAVEEQFYIVFPVVAWLTARLARRHLFTVFGVLTLLSLGAACVYIRRDASAVFYLYPFRAWEMFLGTLLAVGYLPPLRSAAAGLAQSLLGIGLIALPTFLYDKGTLFPAYAAVPPCLGTALLVHAGTAFPSGVQRALAAPVPNLIGRMSYSLYLWHWPIYVLYAYAKPRGIQASDIALMIAATLAISALSWKYVETPIREGRLKFSASQPKAFGFAAALSAVCVCLGLYVHVTNGVPSRLDAETLRFAQAAGDLFGDLSTCEDADNDRLPGISFCALGDPFNADKYLLVWGDSHAGAYKRGLDSAMQPADNPVLIAWSGGCPPVLGLHKDESTSANTLDDRCPRQNAAVRRLIETDQRIQAVVLIGRWSYYVNGSGVGIDDGNSIRIWPDDHEDEAIDQSAYFVSAFETTLRDLRSLHKKVFVVEQVPEFSQFRARELAIGLKSGSADFEQSINELTVEDYAHVIERQGIVQAALAELEKDGLATILRTHKYFCDARRCSLMFHGYPTYFDNNHISSFGAEQISRMFLPVKDFLDERRALAASR
jgi:peptidoglycan/LPS O-acetylase OafA/YrhL